MKLKDARICIDCEEIFDSTLYKIDRRYICPSCCAISTVPLSRWIKTMAEYEKELMIKKIEEHFCPEAA